ncbi:MAG: hypothetical protein Q9186_000526 [Xanthomendoza sp. 1 TL-2023]
MGRKAVTLLPPKHPRTGQRDFSGMRSNSSGRATAGPSSSSTAPQDEPDTPDSPTDVPYNGYPKVHKDNPIHAKADENDAPAWAPGYVPPDASAGPASTSAKPPRWVYPSKDGDDAPAWAPGHGPAVTSAGPASLSAAGRTWFRPGGAGDDNDAPAWAPGYVPTVTSAGPGLTSAPGPMPAPDPASVPSSSSAPEHTSAPDPTSTTGPTSAPNRTSAPSPNSAPDPVSTPGPTSEPGPTSIPATTHGPLAASTLSSAPAALSSIPALSNSTGIAAPFASSASIHKPPDRPATLGAPVPLAKPPPTHLLAPREWMLHGERINKLLWWAYSDPGRWALLVGAYFQTGDRSPSDLGRLWQHASPLNEFRRNWRLLDQLQARGASLSPFTLPSEEVDALRNLPWQDREVFEEAISRWARDPDHNDLIREILKAAFWVDQSLPSGWPHDEDWHIMDTILKLPEGPEKVAKISQAKLESPLFFAACVKDSFCGL